MQEKAKSKTTDLSVTFPQATPASIFPPSASDYFQFDDLLEPEERAVRYKVRNFMEKEVAPIITQYWEKAEFPLEIIPKLGALGIGGGVIKGYGCAGLSTTANAIMGVELARVDASFCSFFGVHTYMATRAIALYGTEEQKQRYLPSLAAFKSIACWAATEPEHGSQATPFSTTATKVKGGWIIKGRKRWIGNSTFADVFIVCANNAETNQTNGFIVRKGTQGLQVTKIENKIGQRIVQNGDVVFDNVFVSDEDRLPGISSSRDLNRLLEVTRLMVSWQCIGIAVGVYDMCHRYVKERKQFGAPLAAFQLTQQKLVRMLSDIQAMLLVGWRLCKLYDSGKMTSGHASMGKSWISLRVREVVALGRELLGGNGILVDFLVGKAFCDLEAAHIYEGTYDINVLIVGKEVLGISSFLPPASSKRSRL